VIVSSVDIKLRKRFMIRELFRDDVVIAQNCHLTRLDPNPLAASTQSVDASEPAAVEDQTFSARARGLHRKTMIRKP
jgi:hypothetical protein